MFWFSNKSDCFILIMMENWKIIFFFKKILVGQLSYCHILVKLMVWHFCSQKSHHWEKCPIIVTLRTKDMIRMLHNPIFFSDFFAGTVVQLSHNSKNDGMTFLQTKVQLRQKSHHWDKCPIIVTKVPPSGQKSHFWYNSQTIGTIFK